MSTSVEEKKNGIVKSLEYFLAFAVGTTVIVVLWQVLSRMIIGLMNKLGKADSAIVEFCSNTSSGTAELSQFLLVWLVMLGAAAAYQAKQHLGLDYFFGNMNPQSRKKIAFVAEFIVLFFVVVVLLFGGFRVFLSTLKLNQIIQALGIPKAYQFLAVPVSGIYFLIFAIQNFKTLLKRDFAAEDIEQARKDAEELAQKNATLVQESK